MNGEKMEESISLKQFGINPFQILDSIAKQLKFQFPEIVDIAYDRQADVLYVQFQINAKAVDNDPLDEEGMILLGLDAKNKMVNMTILNASLLL